MAINDEKLSVLISCGFSLYEARILGALAERHIATANEISELSLVPINKVYQVLEPLVAQEIVELAPTKPKRFRCPGLLNLIELKLKERSDQLQQTIKRLPTVFSSRQPLDGQERNLWITTGTLSMVRTVVEVLTSLKKESLGYIDIWTARPENLRAIQLAILRKVDFYFLGDLDSRRNLKMATLYQNIGVKIKHHEISGAGYSVFDARQVQLRLSVGKVTSLWTNSPPLARVMREHFFNVWKVAKKL